MNYEGFERLHVGDLLAQYSVSICPASRLPLYSQRDRCGEDELIQQPIRVTNADVSSMRSELVDDTERLSAGDRDEMNLAGQRRVLL